MSNPEKNRRIYKELALGLETVARGDFEEKLPFYLLRAHNLFLNGFHSVQEDKSSENFVASTLEDLTRYYSLKGKRQKKIIAGGEREVSTEDDSYESLVLSEKIARNLILPFFIRPNPFSNAIFKDIYNLGLAYLHAATSSVADEYVPLERATEIKLRAVDLAKGALRLTDHYHQFINSFSDSQTAIREDLEFKKLGKTFENLLDRANSRFLRSFELVPTSQKHIHHGPQLMKSISENLTALEGEELKYAPLVIFPIAQGGNEFGLRIAMAYDDKGHQPITYPLLYSIKTRKHKHPWVKNDSNFLGQPLEGEKLLIAEDWITTGNTLKGILEELESLLPKEIKIATIKRDKLLSKISALEKYDIRTGQWAIYSGDKTDSIFDRDFLE